MKWERLVWVVAIVLVAGGGFYTGRLLGVQAGEQNRAQAAQQFFAERGGRNGGTGQVPGGNQAGSGGGTFGGGVNGTVSAVDGTTITITTRQGATTTVRLAADGVVRKQVEGQVGDIAVGDQVMAFGTQSGDTFQATSIQVGELGGRSVPAQAPAP